jgi:hypothetical protein
MEAEKNAKLVAHTSWPAQQTLQFQPPQPTFNPPFQTVPTFGYNPYPINWQPPQQNQPRLPPPPTAQATQEELPPPPPGPPLKQENQTNQNAQPAALPTFGMIMPISGGSSLEFENKKQRRNYFRQVHSIMVDGPVQKTQWSHMPIVFSEEDVNLLSFPHTDALVIEANIQGWTIGKILVDTGSSADIIFSSTFDRMNIDRNLLQPADIPLIGFGGKRVNALGKITLPVSFGDLSNPKTESITFDVVEMNYPYNAIFGRGLINKFEAIVHQLYLCMKMPAIKGVITVRGNQQLARDIERGVAPGQRNVHLVEADKKPRHSKSQKGTKKKYSNKSAK